MNVYTGIHSYYCGIDLHARTMYVCILDKDGKKVYHKNLPCKPERFLQAIEPFREDIVVGVECIFCWYWMGYLCKKEGIDFILGHALYMKAIHGVKTKNDRIDSLKIARLIRGGNFPLAYVYSPEMRATRDLMRRRNHFVRKRAESSNLDLARKCYGLLTLEAIYSLGSSPTNYNLSNAFLLKL